MPSVLTGLGLNLTGCVWTVDQETHNTVTVEFYDRELHRDFHFTDPYLYDRACLSRFNGSQDQINSVANDVQMSTERYSPTTLRTAALPRSFIARTRRGQRVRTGGHSCRRESSFEVSALPTKI